MNYDPTSSNYPFKPHPGKTDTSAAAAQDAARSHRSIQRAVGETVKASPAGLASEQVAEILGLTVYPVRARMAELRAIGCVKDSGARYVNDERRKVIVWQWVPAGPERERLAASLKKAANDAGECCPTCGAAQ